MNYLKAVNAHHAQVHQQKNLGRKLRRCNAENKRMVCCVVTGTYCNSNCL